MKKNNETQGNRADVPRGAATISHAPRSAARVLTALSGLCLAVSVAGCGDQTTPLDDREGLGASALAEPGKAGEGVVSQGSVQAAASAAVAPTSAAVAPASPTLAPSADGTPAAKLAPGVTRNLSMLGYNMDFPGDWTNLPPFIDLMKNARAPQGECAAGNAGCDLVAHLDLDAQGWVKGLGYRDDATRAYGRVRVVVNTSDERLDIGQTFVATWQGTGDVGMENGGNVQLDAASKRLTFRLQPGPTTLTLARSERTDPVRNVRVFRADQEALLTAGEVFNPEMLSYLKPFGSVRFMDWMQSNAEGQCSGGSRHGQSCYAVTNPDCGGGTCVMPGVWNERPSAAQSSLRATEQFLDPSEPGRGTKRGGYPVETMVALANRLGANPHFNMPVAYQDDYVRHFAEYVRDNLGAGLRASVEYSNEVWNWGFPQAQYANASGSRLWPGEGSAWVQFSASRTDSMCKIWKEVFAGQENRMRCLISPQTGWRELAEAVLECPARQASTPGSGPCYQYVDAINITGYFSGCLHENEGVIKSWLTEGPKVAIDRAFEQLNHGGVISSCTDSLDATIDAYKFFKGLADARGLGIYVYESGTHFEYSGDENVREFLVSLTQDERMYDAYERNFAGFREAGGSLFNVWGWVASDDAWANSDSLLDREHPKYRAICDFAAETAAAASVEQP